MKNAYEKSLRIRMSSALMTRIKNAKGPAGWGEEAISSFARHLLIIGLDEVERISEERLEKGISEGKKGKTSKTLDLDPDGKSTAAG